MALADEDEDRQNVRQAQPTSSKQSLPVAQYVPYSDEPPPSPENEAEPSEILEQQRLIMHGTYTQHILLPAVVLLFSNMMINYVYGLLGLQQSKIPDLTVSLNLSAANVIYPSISTMNLLYIMGYWTN